MKNIIENRYDVPKWVAVLKFTATVAVTVTMLTVFLLLAPLWEINGDGYFTLFEGNNFFMHFVNPVLGIITFVFFEKTTELKFKYIFFGLLPTVLYSFLYMTMILIGHWTDFYNFTFGGVLWAIPISVLMMYLLTFFYGFLIWFSQKKILSKNKRKSYKQH